jgi:hypothetical protein
MQVHVGVCWTLPPQNRQKKREVLDVPPRRTPECASCQGFGRSARCPQVALNSDHVPASAGSVTAALR